MIGIIGAMRVEIEALKNSLEGAETITISGIDYYRGMLDGQKVVAAVSGVGKVFAAVCAQTMILRFGVEAIINTGVAGGIAKDISLGDFVIASKLCQHDMDTSGVGDPKGLVSGINKVYFETEPRYREAALKAAEKLGFRAQIGTIASGDQFVCDAERKHWIRDFFGAAAVEMEGAAIAQVCFINEIPFVVIRAISDDASGYAPVSYDSFVKEAAAKSIQLTRAAIAELV